MPDNPFEDAGVQFEQNQKLKSLLQQAARPRPIAPRRQLTPDQIDAILIDRARQYRSEGHEPDPLPEATQDRINEIREAQPDPWSPETERLIARLTEVAEGMTIPTSEAEAFSQYPALRDHVSEGVRHRGEVQEQGGTEYVLAKTINPDLNEDAAAAVVRQVRAEGRDHRVPLMQFAGETSRTGDIDPATDLYVELQRQRGEQHADAIPFGHLSDDQVESAVEHVVRPPSAPRQRRALTDADLDAMTDEEIEAATDAAVTADGE